MKGFYILTTFICIVGMFAHFFFMANASVASYMVSLSFGWMIGFLFAKLFSKEEYWQ